MYSYVKFTLTLGTATLKHFFTNIVIVSFIQEEKYMKSYITVKYQDINKMEMYFIKRYFFFFLCLQMQHVRHVRCYHIKEITMKRSKLTIKFCKIFVDLQKFVVIKVLFKASSGKFISKLLFTVKYDMINSCKIFSIRYKMRGAKHP